MAATGATSPVTTALPTRLIAGVAGGVVFGVLMQIMDMVAMLAGSESIGPGWVAPLAISAVTGSTYGLILGSWADRLAVGAVLGIGYGVLWWVLRALLIMSASMGMGVLMVNAMTLQSLLGHLLYGLVLGLSYVVILSRR